MKTKIIALLLLLVILTSLSVLPADASTTSSSYTLGDVNGDGDINNLDAVYVLKYDAGIIALTEAQLKAADVSGDEVADNQDAALILKFDAGCIQGFPSQYPQGAYIVKSYSALNAVPWNNVPRADIDIYKWVNSVEYEAYAQLVYIRDYGFICRMTCMESDPLTRYTQFGDPVYLDSCMEFFAAWDNQSYINIESNSVGALCAQFGATKNNRKPITDYLSMSEIFDVNPVVEEDKWTLTMDIPISKLQKLYGSKLNAQTFVSGYTFTGNFYKIGSDAVTGVRHYGMWTEVDGNTPNFHQPNCFGTFVIE